MVALVVLDGENYLDGNEVCRLLGVKAATLYAYVSRGLLKSYKQGIKRQRLYKQTEVEALLQLRPSDTPSPQSASEEQTKFSSDPNSNLDSAPTSLDQEKERPEIPRAEDWIPYY